MRTDAGDNSEMVKLNVKVPERLLEELADESQYTNRSVFIREVLRDTTEPILTTGAHKGISQGYTDVNAGLNWEEFSDIDSEFEEMSTPVVIDGRRYIDRRDGTIHEGLT